MHWRHCHTSMWSFIIQVRRHDQLCLQSKSRLGLLVMLNSHSWHTERPNAFDVAISEHFIYAALNIHSPSLDYLRTSGWSSLIIVSSSDKRVTEWPWYGTLKRTNSGISCALVAAHILINNHLVLLTNILHAMPKTRMCPFIMQV